MKPSYYETGLESPPELKASRARAKRQEEEILEFFRFRRGEHHTARKVAHTLRPILLTSVHRGIANLVAAGLLEKTDTGAKSIYGKRVNTWTYAVQKPEQERLF